jgi:hypothetical protein
MLLYIRPLEALSARFGDETGLDALSDHLTKVRETMQPAHVSPWLRPDTAWEKGEATG